MSRFLLKLSLLLIIIVFIDVLFGKGMSFIVNHIEVGGQGRDNYACDKTSENILIFGSSRAVHHYNSQLLEDSTDLTCYNCGDDGSSIILSYGRLLMIKERYQPDVIIQDVTPYIDIFKHDNHKHLGWLKSRYERNGIPYIFEIIDPTEKYKIQCQMYRYNSRFLQNLFVYFSGYSTETGVKGYVANNAVMDTMKINKNVIQEKYEVDSVKLLFFEKFLEAANGSKVFFVVSPIWYGLDTLQVASVKKLSISKGIPFIDFSNSAKYVHNNNYFIDGLHLNAKGADEFTKDLIQELRREIK